MYITENADCDINYDGSRNLKKLFQLILGIFISGCTTEYKVGQVWQYKTRNGEETSLAYIVRIESNGKTGHIFHLYLDGLKMKNSRVQSGFSTILPHIPVDEKTLKASCTKMVRQTINLPDISDGYEIWKEAFDSGDGGIWNIPIDKIIECTEKTINPQ